MQLYDKHIDQLGRLAPSPEPETGTSMMSDVIIIMKSHRRILKLCMHWFTSRIKKIKVIDFAVEDSPWPTRATTRYQPILFQVCSHVKMCGTVFCFSLAMERCKSFGYNTFIPLVSWRPRAARLFLLTFYGHFSMSSSRWIEMFSFTTSEQGFQYHRGASQYS